MEQSTQTDDVFKITNNPDYFPSIEYSITRIHQGKVTIMIYCPLDEKDFSTQTEYNTAFNEDVEMYVEELNMYDRVNGVW